MLPYPDLSPEQSKKVGRLRSLAHAREAPVIETEIDKLNGAMGMDLGAQLTARAVEIDLVAIR
jgi:hypothetical protein